MVTRVGINGFGRVGRSFTRYVLQRTDLEVMVVNDITDARTLAHLLEFDSTYGRLHRVVGHTAGAITIDGREIPVLASRDPAEIDWAKYGVDVVIESTGKFRTREQAALHLKGGARKVLISAPAKGGVDVTIVMGVNDDTYDLVHHELCGTDGEGAARRVRDRARVHDHRARLHRRPDAARRAAQGPSARPV